MQIRHRAHLRANHPTAYRGSARPQRCSPAYLLERFFSR
jgi:hypothetical protein